MMAVRTPLFGRLPLVIVQGTIVVCAGIVAWLWWLRAAHTPVVAFEPLRAETELSAPADPDGYAIALGKRFLRTYHTWTYHTFEHAIRRAAVMVAEEFRPSLWGFLDASQGRIEAQEMTRNVEIAKQEILWHDPDPGRYRIRYDLAIQEWRGPFRQDPFHVEAYVDLQRIADEDVRFFRMEIINVSFERIAKNKDINE